MHSKRFATSDAPDTSSPRLHSTSMESEQKNFIELVTSDRKLKASREGSKYRDLGFISALDGSFEPQKTLRGGIPGSFLEPLARSWSHFVGMHCQKLTTLLKIDF